MPIRVFPQDTPDRETTWRRGIVRARTGSAAEGYHYIVDFPQIGIETAYGLTRYEINDPVHCMWRNEAALWWIAL